jgi:glycerophosphoryl diester phosphodiesterase
MSVPYATAHACGPGTFGPENLQSSAVAATMAGCAVEIDVRSSSQHTPYLMHDWDVARTTNGSGGIINMTDAQINALVPDGAVNGERVPKLVNVLRAVRDANPRCNTLVIIHYQPGSWTQADIDAVYQAVVDTNMQERVMFASWLPGHLSAFAAKNSSIPRMRFMLQGEAWDQDPNATDIMPVLQDVTAEKVATANAAGVRVHSGGSGQDNYLKMMECGIDSNMTNNPLPYLSWLGTSAAQGLFAKEDEVVTVVPGWYGFGAYSANATTATPALPTGWKDGDLCLLFAECSITETVSTPSGWTALTGSPVTTGASTTSARLYGFYRRMVDGDSAPSVTGPTTHVSAVIHGIRGVKQTGNPWNQITTSIEDVADTTFSWPSVTTTVPNCLIIHAVGIGWDANSYGWNGVSNYTNAALIDLQSESGNSTNLGDGGGIGVGRGTKLTAGAVGNTTMEATAANNTYKAFFTIALEPASDQEIVNINTALNRSNNW